MIAAAPARYAWWLAGRSAGAVALLLIWMCVMLGLAMAARVLPPAWRRDAMRVHQHLGLMSLAAIAAHGVFLALDPWLHAGAAVAVPFGVAYRAVWTGLGVLGGYLAAALALSFYARRWIGNRAWRRMHRLTVLAYVLALAHALGAGTDAAIPVVRYATLASAVPVLALFSLRLARGGGAKRRARVAAPAPAPVPVPAPAPAPAPRPARGAHAPHAHTRHELITARAE